MDVVEFIEHQISSNDVVLFMKGTPDAPGCGFSSQVVQILEHLGVVYVGLDVLTSQPLRSAIKEYSNWPTIPQPNANAGFVSSFLEPVNAERGFCSWRESDSALGASRHDLPEASSGDAAPHGKHYPSVTPTAMCNEKRMGHAEF